MVDLYIPSLGKGYWQGGVQVHDTEVIPTDETRGRHRDELLGKNDIR